MTGKINNPAGILCGSQNQGSQDKSGYNYLKNMLNNIADPIFVKDRNHCWIDGNRAFWELMGGPPEKFLGKSDYDFFPKEEADVFWEKDNMVFQTNQSVVNEEYLTDQNGAKHIISTKKTLFLNESGEPVLVGIIRDITAQRELEMLKSHMEANAIGQKLGVLLEKTDQQKRMYETALSNTADFNYVFNLEGRFIFVNKALLDLWHKNLEETIGKNFFELDYPPDLAQKLQDKIQEVIRTKEPLKDETPYTSPDGTLIYEYIFRPVIGADGKVEAVAGSTRDITEYKEANRRKDEFLAMLAHELRNPLAPISNAMHIMKSTSVSEKIREEAAMLVDRQITQMTHLLNDLLDVSRVTLGKIELRPTKVALLELINMAIESAQPLIDERKQKLTVNIPTEPIWLNADRTRMAQVFSNLLNNSAKYTHVGGQINVVATEDKMGVTIKISDNGIGIAREMLPTIFDLFAQVDSSMERAQGGLGIGLTLVKNLVGMHKGTVKASSAGKGQGSEFTVRLPIQIAAREEKQENKPQIPIAKNTYRVLIVDDNKASAKTLGWALEMLGHEIMLAHEGNQAIEIAKSYLPHIILLDIGLPGMNGYEICKILRLFPELENAVIIAQTGWGQKEHLVRSKEAGFNHHLVKPISIETLENIFAGL